MIVREGETIGEGWHAELGGLHAERAALADCEARGEDPGGATIYVTLEPCSHQGRQPPCVDALLEAGISRVVIASDDPSAKTAGRGPRILREAGVAVDSAADPELVADADAVADPEAMAARLLNQPFRKHARTGVPHVTLKLAMSLDGQTATAPGDSPWISGPESRALVHRWRAESDAIAVGIGTALADDPLLTARSDSGATAQTPRQPLRIVFDSQARLPVTSQLLQTIDQAPVLVFTADDADPARVDALGAAGAEVVTASGDTPSERIGSALTHLGGREITSLFLEGGRTLASTFATAGQIDESRTFVAPTLLAPGAARAGGAGEGGAEDAPARNAPPSPATGPARLEALSKTVESVGDDTLITARYKEW